MLGDVARWLRILGEACVYAAPHWDDDEVLAVAREDDRVLVTRDSHLVRRARKLALRAVEVPQTGTMEVLAIVYRTLGLVPDRALSATRCAQCNGPLEEVGADEALERARNGNVPPPIDEVLQRHDRFWSCRVCGQAYWRGSHWDNIEAERGKLIARLQAGI